ncbi:MAG: hypothetical protein H0X57_07310 [Rubrobacter sp.]|nr:hypothetical protein [Rubrobacter sp.]
MLAELSVHPEWTVAGVIELLIFGPEPHPVLLGPDDLRRDGPFVFEEIAHTTLAVVAFAPLEVPPTRQLEQ